MARVYLSFLGTNDYIPCAYFINDRKVENVRFVQEATLQIYCQDWNSEDRILIFTTDEAYRKNWIEDGHVDKNGVKLKRSGLKKCISNLKMPPTVERVAIPEGKSEKEIWEIFNIVFSKLNQGDEAIFDITHAFRSISMLAIVVLNYAKIMKGIFLLGIYYGAFEVIGSYNEVKNIPIEDRYAPIFDLTSFDVLIEWAIAIDRFLGSGDAGPACNLAKKELTPVLKSSQGRDRTAVAIQNIANKLEAFTQALTTCRGTEISDKTSSLKEAIERSEKLELIHAFHPLINRIKEQIKPFQGNAVQDGIQAAKWCLDHNLIQQGYTILEETLITYMALKANVDPMDMDKREIVTPASVIYSTGVPQDKWLGPAFHHPEVTKLYLKIFDTHRELANVFRVLADYRNDLNHAGYRKHSKPVKSFQKKLETLISDAGKQIDSHILLA